jgi:Uma2 family endonuclease
MVANPSFSFLSPEEYLEWEATQELRYEYIDGEVFAMTGGTKPHNRIAFNLATALDNHLAPKDCEVYIADVKVKVDDTHYHYPDGVVSCDERDLASNSLIQYPCLIIEVLSPSTEAFDRGKKFTHYRQLETLQEYVIVESQKVGIDLFRRNEQGLWVLHPLEVGDTLILESVGLSLPLETIYRQVRFETKEQE